MAHAASSAANRNVTAIADFDRTAEGMPLTFRAPNVDRDARALLRGMNVAEFKPGAYPLTLMRERFRMIARGLGRHDFNGVQREVMVGPADKPVHIRIYTPSGRKVRPVFVWFHGGAFLIGGPDTADSICRNIANKTDFAVIAVEYRLAPEHSLHDGRADCIVALDWIYQHGAEYGIDPERLALGGDSAGGNLAAVMAQECRKRGRHPKLQVLIYPATNLAESYPSLDENASGYMLTAEMIDWIRMTIGDEDDSFDVRLSPIYEPQLGGLADALVISAGYDPIRDDGLHYAQLLRNAGVPVEIAHYAGEFHGFLNFDTVVAAARDALNRIAIALVDAFDDKRIVDRTTEIADPGAERDQSRVPDLFSEWMTSSFMAGEWFEYQRNRTLKAFLPMFASPLADSQLFNMASTLRNMTTQSALEAHVTYEQN
ncbi:carboxylesterase NlhH [Variibacter gotjawalensis]|uniref:Carboxylesterase NlhH n=1 Tax=Variibacter gotjawalensis TaxID=1333996 RepID=A0A0S3PZS4_9BRAD|nr:alpha/beta hydrolase [Variibacter gotjawalensis]NIK47257.1 acetyl esterase [Variibacter gotjawalensis]RZS49157.1 acetyl esterase/lipase [Variibacter gotjawalensis]BAT61419.1 carboxylesterase NlhH [Variibacter gotjawalensis]